MQSTELSVSSPGSGHPITIRRNGQSIEAFDTFSNTIVNSLETAFARSVTYNGLAPNVDVVTIDYGFGGYFDLPDGIQLLTISGGDDTVRS